MLIDPEREATAEAGMGRAAYASETYRSLVRLGMLVVKALMVLNGGSVIGLLAYLGNSDLVPSPGMLEPIAVFVAGVGMAVLAAILGWIVQFGRFRAARDGAAGRSARRYRVLLWLAVLAAALSLLAFMAGAILATLVLIQTGDDSAPGPLAA